MRKGQGYTKKSCVASNIYWNTFIIAKHISIHFRNDKTESLSNLCVIEPVTHKGDFFPNQYIRGSNYILLDTVF